ncbi:hypothetical protein CALVIDRAFT_553264 [Calocera viscosa TUFC12733]|uniref:DUF1772-domain-containing protein n=1 Tax=Calocera viscosa (strain TUFC12733) TaxID=1330018 RepID=A0A167Q1E3_CALVF|nr:hypothetical protein CALVIDRAFT_553264 [Calocera viscosa TUFC12733]
MSDTLTRVIQAVALGSSSFLAGFITTFSVSIPALSLAPPPLAAQVWRALYKLGKGRAPYVALLSTASYAYLAYHAGSSLETAALAAAGACVIAIVPYTFAAMGRTNGRLLELAASASKGGSGERTGLKEPEPSAEEVSALLGKWTGLNYARAMLPAIGAAVGFWVVFGW